MLPGAAPHAVDTDRHVAFDRGAVQNSYHVEVIESGGRLMGGDPVVLHA